VVVTFWGGGSSNRRTFSAEMDSMIAKSPEGSLIVLAPTARMLENVVPVPTTLLPDTVMVPAACIASFSVDNFRTDEPPEILLMSAAASEGFGRTFE